MASALKTNASGMPSPRARAGLLQLARSLGSETCMPSVNSTVNWARSAVADTISQSGVMWISPRKPSLTSTPPTRKRVQVESIVRAARPDNSTAVSSAAPNTTTSSMPNAPIGRQSDPLLADQASRHTVGNLTGP